MHLLLLATTLLASPLGDALGALTAPRTPARCAPVEEAAKMALATQGLEGTRTLPCVVEVSANGTGPVAELVKRLAGKGIHVVFDAGYLAEHPYAAASFDATAHLVRVPASFIDSASADDPVLQHELVHAAIFTAAERDEATTVAYLRGPPFQPNDLALDEMRAYAEDLARAAQALKKTCGKASNAAWARIWSARTRDATVEETLEGCDALYDRAVAKMMFGKHHTEPAQPALEGLTHVALKSEMSGDINEVILRGAATYDGASQPIELHLVKLAPWKSDDYRPRLGALIAQTKAHATSWQKSGETLERLSRAKSKEISGLLDTLVKRTKPATATPAL